MRGRAKVRGAALGAGLVALAVAAGALPSGAAVVKDRTVRVAAPDGSPANLDSANPSISSTGRLVVFDSSASNFGPLDENARVRDVYAVDDQTGERLLVSRAPGGPAANGPSGDPELSGPSRRVVFTSGASNLVAGDTNGRADIFIREGAGPIFRVSVTFDGKEANGDSFQPDISDDGRFVVFASNATNLVESDTNGVDDVFVRDLRFGTTRRVSLRGRADEVTGRSGTPAISPEGRYISFESEATDLVPRDRNGVNDVFVRDVSAGRTSRVSVSGDGREQNRSVIPPFRQVSDVSEGGRFVVFESDATNLVSRDTNRDTDVFVSDRRSGRITRVSVNGAGVQGDNDSFAPAVTPDGRFVIFESFAQNLAPGDEAREDIFLHDRERNATVLVSVSAEGLPRSPERVTQLLQQPAISNSGRVAAFISTADNLTAGDTNGVADLFLRDLTPPSGRLARAPRFVGRAGGTFTVSADDPQAKRVICRVGRFPQAECGFPNARITGRLPEGRHSLRAHVGGPGMLFDPRPLLVRFVVDRSRPAAVIDVPRNRTALSSLGTVRGRAADRVSGVARVEVAVVAARVGGSVCRAYDGRRFVRSSCSRRTFVRARGRRSWRLGLRQRPRGVVLVVARAVDRAGNRSRAVRSLAGVR